MQEIFNGKIHKWLPDRHRNGEVRESGFQNTANRKLIDARSIDISNDWVSRSWWSEFKWLFLRNMKQLVRDKVNSDYDVDRQNMSNIFFCSRPT